MNILNRNREYLFQKRDAELSVSYCQQVPFTILPRDDEICLGVSHAPSRVRDFRAHFNEFSIFQLIGFCSPSSVFPTAFLSLSFCLNGTSVHAFQKPFYGISRYAGQTSFMVIDSTCDAFWRTVLQQLFLNEISQCTIHDDLSALKLCSSSAHVCFVVRFLGIVSSLDPVSLAFV